MDPAADDMQVSDPEVFKDPLPGPSSDHDYHVPPESSVSQLHAAQSEIDRLKEEVLSLRKEQSLFTRLSKDPALVKFYTGFENYEILINVFHIIEPTAARMTSYSQYCRMQSGHCKNIRLGFYQRSIPLIDEFVLVLRKLRVGSFDQELADQYNISSSTVSRVIISWLNYLYFVLGSLPLWPSRTKVVEHLPDIFREEYPRTRVILDCTEIWVQRPSSLVLNSEFYSHYKGEFLEKAPFSSDRVTQII